MKDFDLGAETRIEKHWNSSAQVGTRSVSQSISLDVREREPAGKSFKNASDALAKGEFELAFCRTLRDPSSVGSLQIFGRHQLAK